MYDLRILVTKALGVTGDAAVMYLAEMRCNVDGIPDAHAVQFVHYYICLQPWSWRDFKLDVRACAAVYILSQIKSTRLVSTSADSVGGE